MLANTTATGVARDAVSTVSSFESWHFDALSDDGREALLITFNNNYAFSPRYFRESRRNSIHTCRFPALTFTYSVDGRVLVRAVNEFRDEEFSCPAEKNTCTIGNSSFRHETAAYGSGFMLHIEMLTARRCQLVADLEWVSIETGPRIGDDEGDWNVRAPRSDVSGTISRIARKGRDRKTFHFRGTGYHDYFRSASPLEEAVETRWWGRAHFVDSTAIFLGCRATGGDAPTSRLLLVGEETSEREVTAEAQNRTRDRYGLSFPARLSFVSSDNVRLRVKPVREIEAGFFKKVLVSEITLMLRDGNPRKTLGITTFTAPGRLKNSLFRWASDLRTGKKGRSPLF